MYQNSASSSQKTRSHYSEQIDGMLKSASCNYSVRGRTKIRVLKRVRCWADHVGLMCRELSLLRSTSGSQEARV